MGRGGGVVGLTENKATQPSLAGAWAELGKIEDIRNDRKMIQMFFDDFKNLSVGNFDCNFCDFKGKTTGGLKTHKKRKHKDK